MLYVIKVILSLLDGMYGGYGRLGAMVPTFVFAFALVAGTRRSAGRNRRVNILFMFL